MKTRTVKRLLRSMAVNSPSARLDRRVAVTLEGDLLSETEREGSRMLGWRRLAAVAGCVLLAIAAAWAGTRVVKRFVVEESEEYISGPEEIKSEGGTSTWQSIGVGKKVVVKSDDPQMTYEKAGQRYEEIKQLAAMGRGKLVEVVEDKQGLETYIYEFTLSNGTVETCAFSKPLLSSEQEASRREEIKELIRSGKGELIETTTDTSGATYYRYRYTLSDGSVMCVTSNRALTEM